MLSSEMIILRRSIERLSKSRDSTEIASTDPQVASTLIMSASPHVICDLGVRKSSAPFFHSLIIAGTTVATSPRASRFLALAARDASCGPRRISSSRNAVAASPSILLARLTRRIRVQLSLLARAPLMMASIAASG